MVLLWFRVQTGGNQLWSNTLLFLIKVDDYSNNNDFSLFLCDVCLLTFIGKDLMINEVIQRHHVTLLCVPAVSAVLA